MAKKILLATLALCAIVISQGTGRCFADAPAQLEKAETYKWYPARAEQIYQEIARDYPGSGYALEAQKNLVISYISAKRGGDAQVSLNELAADFTGHSGLPAALYDISRTYERSRKYEKVNSIYQQIIQQYPESSSASEARLYAPRSDVLSYIESKDDNGAAVAIDNLISNFSGHSGLPSSLYDIARRYERAKKYDKVKGLYQQIIQQYAGSPAAGRAELAVERTGIFSLIESGRPAASEINRLMVSFSGHSDLSEALYDIAIRYERVKKYEEASSIYQRVIQQHPDSSHAARARLIIPKINILSLIESGNYTEAQAGVDSLVADFSGHSYLPAVLCNIARIYEWSGQYEQAKGIYQHVAQQYPETSYAGEVQLNIPKNRILSLIVTGSDSEAQVEIDKLVADFRGDGRVGWTLSRLAEQYCVKANQLETQGLVEQGRQYVQKAIAVYETVVSEFSGSTATPEACYLAGNHYRKLGEYEKSTQYYQKVVDDYSGYRLAWSARFMIGRNYEELKESGALSKSEADAKIKAAYQQLLEKYPNCKAAKIARRWLSYHN